MKNVEVLTNLTPEQGAILAKDLTIDLPLQAIEVVKTIRKVNRTDDKKDWQGYLIKFKDNDVVIPISGGIILHIANKQEVDAFKETESLEKDPANPKKTIKTINYELVIDKMGYDQKTKSFFLVKL